jgi:RNA-directed DNA polymerase
VSQAKPFDISKQVVVEAYKRVKANRGACGVDEESIQDFERNQKDNLYKIWNRMSSGSYFPLPVRRVEIPKASGSKRPLGIPTVSDRIAQMVVKMYLEPKLEPYFHKDSYGYRPKKSAIEALGVARERCWRYDWVLDLDIRGFFDNLDHELLMRAVRKHTESKWIVLYIERWLKAPVQCEDGTRIHRDKGSPQGSVVSPLLANLFLHYALDEWIRKNYPDIRWERFADDAVFHCKTEAEAQALKAAIEKRLAECRLELNPEKTKIVYCKDGKRKKNYPEKKFDFLGYTFRPRKAKDYRGQYFCNFSPAVSQKAKKEMSRVIRNWGLHRRSGSTLEDLSEEINPTLRGWVNYYGRYYRSGLYPIFRQLECVLMRWAMRKYKRFRDQQCAVAYWLKGIAKRSPSLFAHWTMRIA